MLLNHITATHSTLTFLYGYQSLSTKLKWEIKKYNDHNINQIKQMNMKCKFSFKDYQVNEY